MLRCIYESLGISQRPRIETVSGGEVRDVTRTAFSLIESVVNFMIPVGAEKGVIWFLREHTEIQGPFNGPHFESYVGEMYEK